MQPGRNVAGRLAACVPLSVMRREVAVVVPVWFPEEIDDESARMLLSATLQDSGTYLEWTKTQIVVDGSDRWARVARTVQDEIGGRCGATFALVETDRNGGKGYAVLAGIERVLAADDTAYVAVWDCDGDHSANELMTLYRVAKHIETEEGNGKVLVVGQRADLHASLGYIRGQLELLMNRTITEGLKYRLAQDGCVFDTRYCAMYGSDIDIHSGYKLFSRELAALYIRSDQWQRTVVPECDLYRWGVEAIPWVESVMAGATVGAVLRSSYVEQPASAHSEFADEKVVAGIIAWAMTRLDVPTTVAQQIVANELPRLTLVHDAGNRTHLLRIASRIIDALAAARNEPTLLNRRFVLPNFI